MKTDWYSHLEKLKRMDSFPLDDKFWRLQNLYPIVDKTGAMLPLRFNEHQQHLAECIAYNLARDDFSPITILKARQVGISTFCCLWFLDDVLFYRGRNAIVQSYQHLSKDVVFRIIHTAYKYSYSPFRGFIRADKKDVVSADTVYIPALESRIESRIKVRSEAANMLLFTEFAFMEWQNILATIGSASPKCLKIYESTAKGRNHLYRFWGEQKEKDTTGTHCLFFGWHAHKEYWSIPPPGGLGELDDVEINLKERFNLNDGQLFWRRNKRAEISLNEEHNSFEQEFPADDVECFNESGDQLFEIDLLESLFYQTAKAKPVKKYWLTNKKGKNTTLVKIFKEFSQDEINKKREKGRFFDIFGGVDPAEGVGRDFSVCVVFSIDHLQKIDVLMTLRGHTDPTNFSEHLEQELRRYRFWNPDFDESEKISPLLTVERNNHGHAVLALLEPTYDNLYYDPDQQKLGFMQTNVSRKRIMHNLLNLLRQRKITLNDPIIAQELGSLHINEIGKIEAHEGHHDDTVLALALAFEGYYRDQRNYPLDEEEEEENKKEENKTGFPYSNIRDYDSPIESVLLY